MVDVKKFIKENGWNQECDMSKPFYYMKSKVNFTYVDNESGKHIEDEVEGITRAWMFDALSMLVDKYCAGKKYFGEIQINKISIINVAAKKEALI